MNFKIPTTCSAVLILYACTSSSGVLPMGLDTYTVTTSDELGGVIGAKKRAVTEANIFCQDQNKNMLPLNTNQQSIKDWAGDSVGHYEIIFRCLDLADSDYKRPDIDAK